LCEIFIRSPNADLLHSSISRRNCGCRSQRIIGFEFDHGPNRNAHRAQRFFERLELHAQRGIDSLPVLVTAPKFVAKGLDDVIGGDAYMRGPSAMRRSP
jgi:hypothetical protein